MDNKTSLWGALMEVRIPADAGFNDPREIGRALVQRRYGLSPEQIRLLELLAAGLRNAELASELHLAEETPVKNRLKLLYRKLGVRNRLSAAQIATYFGFGGIPKAPSSIE